MDGITKRFAEKALASRMGDIAKGRFDIAQTKTYPLFKKLLDKYLEIAKVHKKSYRRDLISAKHIRPMFGNKRVHDISSLDIERYKVKRKNEILSMKKNRGKDDRDISFTSINRELALLKHFYTMAIKWRIVDRNPVKGIQMFPEKMRERYLLEDEIPALLTACERSKNKSLKTIVTIALYTGGRLMEVLSLKVSELDFKNSIIYFEYTKNGDRGEIPMADNLRDTLKGHIEKVKQGYLFCNADGTQLKSIRKAFTKATRDAGLEDFRFHDLRHTYLSHLAMRGIEGRTLQDLGRFKTPRMVMRYAHLSAAHMKKAVDTLGSLFQNKHETSPKVISASFSNSGNVCK